MLLLLQKPLHGDHPKNNTNYFPTCGNLCAAKDTKMYCDFAESSVRLFFVLCEWKRVGNKKTFLPRKERDRVMYTSGKEGRGKKQYTARKSGKKRDVDGVREALVRSVDEEGGGRNLLYLHNSRLIYTHTPFSPLRRPQLGRGRKKGTLWVTLFLSLQGWRPKKAARLLNSRQRVCRSNRVRNSTQKQSFSRVLLLPTKQM